jgi:acyl transferase domain-containing protein
VCLHNARGALLLSQCGAALAAGVNLTLTPDTPASFQRAGMLSPDGRCKTLDEAADGYVRAEACGALMLQMLRNHGQASVVGQGASLALLSGTAVNQDGRSSALTAPNGPAQQQVIRWALGDAGFAAAAMDVLQMHGTGGWLFIAAVVGVAV